MKILLGILGCILINFAIFSLAYVGRGDFLANVASLAYCSATVGILCGMFIAVSRWQTGAKETPHSYVKAGAFGMAAIFAAILTSFGLRLGFIFTPAAFFDLTIKLGLAAAIGATCGLSYYNVVSFRRG